MTQQPIDSIFADFDVRFGPESGSLNLEDFTIQKVMLGESLLTPGLQTTVVAHSYRHSITPTLKNYDPFKNAIVNINIKRDFLQKFNKAHELDVIQRVYRLENRNFINPNVEELTIRACDDTMLNDASSLVSKSWKCTTPSEVVGHVLTNCAGARSLDIESSSPARDYIAENIHPFQVVSQQSNVALAEGNDPSFLHYMTYQNYGTHHFRSLKSLTKQSPVMKYYETETGIVAGYGAPEAVQHLSFPCDFDLLTDVLNGIGTDGRDINSLVVFNPLNKMFSLVGDQTVGCGIGSGVIKYAQTNINTAQQQNSCNFEVEKYLLRRQARMSLLSSDKIALRMTVPWLPELNVGKVIELKLRNKQDPTRFNYGSGKYLILHMMHEVRRGGYAITTMDCVSTTVGEGVV